MVNDLIEWDLVTLLSDNPLYLHVPYRQACVQKVNKTEG
jgi:hypothetical protein